MKLARKLLIVVFVGALFTVTSVSLLSYFVTKVTLENSASASNLDAAKLTIHNVDRVLNQAMLDIQVIASQDFVQNYLRNVYIEPDVIPETSSSLSITKLDQMRTITGPWDSLSILDTSGQVVYTTTGSSNVEIPRELYNKSIKGIVSYSDVMLDKNQKPTIYFVSPVRDEKTPGNPIKGLVMGKFSWQVIVEVLHGRTDLVARLYDKNGNLIASNVSNYSLESVPKKETTSSMDISKYQNKDGSEVKNNLLTSYVTEPGYRSYKGNEWLLRSSVPTSVAYAPLYYNTLTVGGTLTLVIIFSFGIILLLILRFIKPLEEITKVSKDMAAGHLEARVKVTTNDETGELANSFNNMAEKLNASYSDMENNIRQKTKLLVTKIQELDKEKTKDEAILNSVGDGLILTNKEGKVLLVNKIAEEILGINAQSAGGKTVYEAFKLEDESGEKVSLVKRPMYLALQLRQKITGTFLVSRNDKKVSISITATPVILNNEVIGAIEIVRDVTKEKEIDRMKTEFISLASHQLRTPLSAMKWFSEMLLANDAGNLNDEQRMFVKNIYDSNERMIDLVNALLNISRIESGRIIIEPKPTDLSKLIEEVIIEIKPRLDEKKHKLIVSAKEDLPLINIDPKLIRHVYMNLLTNAIKYTPDGGEITIFISKDAEQVISQVSDTGYGIPEKEQNRIFQKFYRGENIISVETDGTGLGLYLTKAIVASSGGKIWFRSEENKGTTFWFSLPLAGSVPKKGEVTISS